MNLEPFIRQLSIQDRMTGRLRPFPVNWAQQEYLNAFHEQWNAGRPVRIIVLKARQLGISTMTSAIGFGLSFARHNQNSLIVAHEMDSSEHLLTMSQRYWDNFLLKRLYTQHYQSKKHLSWVETGSNIKVITAGNTDAGRGRTIQTLHASEVAFWNEAETLMLALSQTVPDAPNTFICLESTANGVGNYFHSTWEAAVAGEVDYQPLFFPWFRHWEYRASAIGIKPYDLGNLSPEERALQHLIPAATFEDCVAWRRWAIKNKCGGSVEKFMQEYPATPTEAFITSGFNVFPQLHLDYCYVPEDGVQGRLVDDDTNTKGVRFVVDPTGPLTIFGAPHRDPIQGQYFVGGDPSRTTRGDYACVQVINRRSLEQVAIWRKKIDPGSFAKELANIGLYYNTATLAPECTGPGYATIGRLLEMGYPRLWKPQYADKIAGGIASTFGWNTTVKTKEWAVGTLLRMIVDHDITIHDPHTFVEVKNYVSLPGGGYGPSSNNGHDDTVMALAIALCASWADPPPDMGEGPKLMPIDPDTDRARRTMTVEEATDPSTWDDFHLNFN